MASYASTHHICVGHDKEESTCLPDIYSGPSGVENVDNGYGGNQGCSEGVGTTDA